MRQPISRLWRLCVLAVGALALAGCGSSGGGGGGGGGVVPPVTDLVVRDASVVHAMSTDGRLAGASRWRAAYWSQHRADPVLLGAPAGYTTVMASDVDATGRIAGVLKGPYDRMYPVIWAGPGAQPTPLPMGPGYQVPPDYVNSVKLLPGRGAVAAITKGTADESVIAVWRVPGLSPVIADTATTRGQLPQSVSDDGTLVTQRTNRVTQLQKINRITGIVGAPIDLAALSGRTGAKAEGLSIGGRMAGIYNFAPDVLRPLWFAPDGAATDLPPLPGGTESWATVINDAGLVGGFTYTTRGQKATAWRGANVVDLNTMLPRGSDVRLQKVIALANDGRALCAAVQGAEDDPTYVVVRVP